MCAHAYLRKVVKHLTISTQDLKGQYEISTNVRVMHLKCLLIWTMDNDNTHHLTHTAPPHTQSTHSPTPPPHTHSTHSHTPPPLTHTLHPLFIHHLLTHSTHSQLLVFRALCGRRTLPPPSSSQPHPSTHSTVAAAPPVSTIL